MPDGFASWGKEVVDQSLYSVPPPGMTHARVCGACEALSPAELDHNEARPVPFTF